MSGFNYWQTEITFLKKVGPKRALILDSEAQIKTFGDLLHYFPRKYVDRSQVNRISQINPHSVALTLIGKITSMEEMKGHRGGRLTAVFEDGSGAIQLVWFKGIKWIKASLKIGQEVAIYGLPRSFKGGYQISHPEIDYPNEEESFLNNLKIVPHYPGTEKLNRVSMDSRGFRAIIEGLLEGGKNLIHENLSPQIIRKYSLCSRQEALTNIHFPESFEKLAIAQHRLKFEEFFFFQLMLAERKAVQQPLRKSHAFPIVGEHFNTFYQKHLPFELTEAQKRVIKEIRRDLSRPYQMNRLVQGDVGCGKTMVAFMTALIAIDNGFQVAMMAPTEILAEQHFQKFTDYAIPLGLKVDIIVGGQRKGTRNKALESLVSGETHIVVGTHALIEDPIVFKRLGLAIVDEQHKFGVKQRAALWQKGEFFPHNMVMTATPIPRTLGMTLYGDLEVSVIDELPPGRTPVITAVRTEAERLAVFGFIRKELQSGRQAYIVYPLVEESEKLDYLAVTIGYEAISRAFPEYRVGIVHGRQKAANKDFEMQRFKKGELQILVSTTVIEVGVDVPNATIMVIENAEKFGLSQLHQLRGRVGRGGNQSFCILMVGTKASNDAKVRLKAMVNTNDGFKISEIDLKLRGPGDFMGTRQSGLPEFRLGNIVEDGAVLAQSREAAFFLIENDPKLEKEDNSALKSYFYQYLHGLGHFWGIA